MSVNGGEFIAGLLLLFFVPGYAVTKATFPEWRVRGRVAVLRLLEIATLAFVTSVGLAVLVGYLLLVGGPTGFQAYWSDPQLEIGLGVIALGGFLVGWFRGAYRREAPAPPVPEAPSEPDAWELVAALDRLRRDERRVRHDLRRAAAGSPEAARLEHELDRIRAESSELSARREAEYAT
jgi:hypothetical protein